MNAFSDDCRTRSAAAVAVIVAGIAVVRNGSDQSEPTRDDPPAYTKALVQKAIQRYERDGKQATIDYYNSTESIDGEW